MPQGSGDRLRMALENASPSKPNWAQASIVRVLMPAPSSALPSSVNTSVVLPAGAEVEQGVGRATGPEARVAVE